MVRSMDTYRRFVSVDLTPQMVTSASFTPQGKPFGKIPCPSVVYLILGGDGGGDV